MITTRSVTIARTTDIEPGAVLAPPAPEPVKAYPLRVDTGSLVIER